jgi:branched-subunit amino acid ABC-type transport system permease component
MVAMRKIILLSMYLAMIAVGLWATYDWMVFGGRGIVFKASGFLALFGAYLLWIDFLSPTESSYEGPREK